MEYELNKKIQNLSTKIIDNNLLCIIFVILLTSAILQAQQPAFPTAEGSGRFATGGVEVLSMKSPIYATMALAQLLML